MKEAREGQCPAGGGRFSTCHPVSEAPRLRQGRTRAKTQPSGSRCPFRCLAKRSAVSPQAEDLLAQGSGPGGRQEAGWLPDCWLLGVLRWPPAQVRSSLFQGCPETSVARPPARTPLSELPRDEVPTGTQL